VSLLGLLPLQGYVTAYAGVTLPNPASVGLHEALGFESLGVYRHVGFKYGVWHDVVWLQRLLQPLPAEPGPLVGLEEARALPAWERLLRAGLEG
jgi:phosphinothricin acetyltransferase